MECQAVYAKTAAGTDRCGWSFSSAINSEMVPKAIRRVANGFLSASNQGYFLIATKHHHHFKLRFLCQNWHTDQYCGCTIWRIFFPQINKRKGNHKICFLLLARTGQSEETGRCLLCACLPIYSCSWILLWILWPSRGLGVLLPQHCRNLS